MTTEDKAPLYEIGIGRHAGYAMSIEMAGDTVERACNGALAYAQDAFTRWRPEAAYGPYFITGITCLSAGDAEVPVPQAYRPPAAGLVHQEICAVVAALRFLARYLDAPEARPFDRCLSGDGTVEPLDAAAIGALADRFID